MRESIARAVNSKNLQQKEQHCNLDLVHSLGIAAMNNPLGVSALHLVDGLQPNQYADVIFRLSREAGKRIKCDKSKLLLVCKRVIYESAFTFCKTCYGTKQFIADSKVHICEPCNGTGLERHTDRERSKSLNISEDEYVKHWAKRLTLVQSIYSSEWRNALHTARLKITE
jgi:hypothetical protein